jgi:hypothetical protein
MIKRISTLLVFTLLAVNSAHADVPAGNFWPNPTFELGDTLDVPTGTPTGWNRGGNNPALCEVTSAGSVSATHSLIVNDTDAAGYAEWYSDLPLAGLAAPGDQLDLQWSQMFSTAGGEMRVTILFFNAANNIVGTFHFVVNGDSPGWTGDIATSPFQLHKETIPVGAGAVTMRVSLVSGGPSSATGVLLIDDFSTVKAIPPAPDILVGNFLANSTFEAGDNLNFSTGTPTGWRRSGSATTIAQISRAKAISATHSLAIIDNDAAKYGAWETDQALPCSASEGRLVNLQWFEMFNITGGEMRLTCQFLNADSGVVGERHFVATGKNAGWVSTLANSPFVRRNEQVVVPADAKNIHFSLVSGGDVSVTGSMLIDNLSAAVEPTPPTLLFNTIWPNGSFEEGVGLDVPATALPTGWQRGGNDPTIDIVTTQNSASSTHALGVIDNNAAGYGEWYANIDLAGRAAAGDQLNLQWFELFNVATGGEMRLSILFWDANNGLLGEKHFTATGQSAGWSGDVACSTFTKRNEAIIVPANAARLQISLVSGGPAETTGVMFIDDFSVAKPLPPPSILVRNFWPNPTFEEGDQLDNPGAGSPLGWNRGGSDSRGDIIRHDKATSPTHSLALNDTNANGYSEWYASVSLIDIATAGNSLNLQWQQVYDTTGQMRLTATFIDGAGVAIGHSDFTVNGQSPNWSGDLATSPFEKRNEVLIVPDTAARLQLGIASGGGSEVTGSFIIDDLSVATVTEDSDGDGLKDADELLAGTLSTDPASVLKSTTLSKEATGANSIAWSSVPGKTYAIEFSLTPAASGFTVIPGAESIPASNTATTTYTDTTPRSGSAGYYRVKLVQ